MTKVKTLTSKTLAVASIATMFVAQIANAAGGYGSNTVNAPTVYAKNTWYSVALPIPSGAPIASTDKVGIAYYKYAYLGTKPAGFIMYLCNNDGSLCGDISSSASGSVDFTGAGVPANQTLRYYARVNGSGTMSAYQGTGSNVTVNYGP